MTARSDPSGQTHAAVTRTACPPRGARVAVREEVADEAQAARPAAHSSGRKKWAEVDPLLQCREYSVAEAVSLIQELAVANFDESIDVVMKLGLDPRKADQQIRGMAALPHNTGKAGPPYDRKNHRYQEIGLNRWCSWWNRGC